VRPGGQYVYTANLGADTVSVFSIGSGGSLTPVSCPGSNCNTGTDPYGVAITPNGQFLYTANRASNTVSAFSIGSGGSLTPISCGASCNTLGWPQAISVSPSGQHLYVANRDSDRVSIYSIGSGGSLTPISCTTNCNTGDGPMWMAIRPNGQHLYTVNRGAGTVSVFSIGAGGTLTPVSCGTNCNTGPNPGGIAVSPDGQNVYVSNFGTNTVTPYSVGGTGALTPISCTSPNCNTASGPDFQSLVVSPNQAPTAAFDATPAGPGQPTSFDGSGSTAAPGQSVARYDWDFGDGQTAPNAGPTPTHTYASEGEYTVTLTVTDNAGCSTSLVFTGQTASCNGSSTATTTHLVSVDGVPPDTQIDSPRLLTTADATPTFAFHASEPGSTFECSIDSGAPSFDPCSGPGASHTPASPLSDGLYLFRVRATDPQGNTGPAAVEMFRVDTAIHPPKCPSVSSSVSSSGHTRGRVAGAASQSRRAGVRARLIVDQPSLVRVRAKLAWHRRGRSRKTNLGVRILPVSDSAQLRLALSRALADDLPLGAPVRLQLKITATADSSPGCVKPPVDRHSLRTRVVRVRASG
jgi:6-phosphogluconolactonase (cycloisomerase 2 family)